MTLSIAEVKAGVARSHEEFADFVEGLSDDEWSVPSRCEGWTTGDVARHVVGGMADIAAGRFEGLGTEEVTAREVADRQGHGPAELATELREAMKANLQTLDLFDDEAWNGPSVGGYEGTLLQGVEALWYDAVLHADDIRAAIERPSDRTSDDVRVCVHHVAFELGKRGWGPATLSLDGIEKVDVGEGGDEITGDPSAFILAATGRADPTTVGLDSSVNIYAE